MAKPGLAIDWGVVLICVAYAFCAVARAAHSALWMDEVLAANAAMQADWHKVIALIWIGTDFSPPTYHLLLHALPGLASHERLVARIPSILAVFGAAACMAAIVRRRFAAPIATIIFAATLASPLFGYAMQARQYGLTTLCLAAALALWDRLPAQPRQSPALLLGLWAALAACISLHFYGVVVVGALVFCEIARTVHARTVRLPVWLVFVALVPVLLAWLPLSMHLRVIGSADQVGPGFYGTPTIGVLIQAIIDLAMGGAGQVPLYAGVVLAIVAGAAPTGAPDRAIARRDSNLIIIMLALAAIPFGAYGLAVVATGSFVERYAVGVALLPGLLMAIALASCRDQKRALAIFVPFAVIALVTQVQGGGRTQVLAQAQDIVAANPAQQILVGNGGLYLELAGNLPADQAARVAFLAPPAGAVVADPTNAHEVARLAAIDPKFHVVSFEQAMAQTSGFALIRTRAMEADDAFEEILRRKAGVRLIAQTAAIEDLQIQPASVGHTR